MCKQGCFCKKGLLRNSEGKCVTEEKCVSRVPLTPTCGANEEFATCGSACPLTCENRNDKTPRPCPAMCVIGCQCKKGFFKNQAGQCVTEEKCGGKTNLPIKPVPKKCSVNEVFTTCGSACPLTCANRNNPPKICTLQCVIGCQCAPGFFKNSAGKCVKESECEGQTRVARKVTKQCGTNEVFTPCASTCPKTCANRNQGPMPCNMMCKLNSCECKKGFLRNGAGKCVKEEQCEDSCTGKNEMLTGCGARCQPKCGVNGPQICPAICAPGCTCQKGFARDDKGDCVRKEKCPKKPAQPTKKCDTNEVFTPCASTCPKTCANRNQGPMPCNRMCKLNSCECKKGFVRSGTGKCVREDHCEDTCTGKNEILTGCGARCQPKCGVNGPQPCLLVCQPGCTCQEGFARNPKGQCVKREECPRAELAARSTPQMQCNGKHEEYTECNGRCDKVCGDFISPGCFQEICVPGCVCKKGYARNKINVCMEQEQCPNINAKRSEAGPNEVFSPCAAHCTPTCNNKNPICNRMCVPGFTCQKGFFRNTEGRCVTEAEC